MPCARCDSLKISIRRRLACPRCEHIRLVPRNDAGRKLEELACRAEKQLVGEMRAYARDDILTTVFKKREQIARESRFDRRLMDVRTVLGCSAAIKKIATTKAGFGSRPVDSERLSSLSQMLGNMLLRMEKASDLEAGTYVLLHMEKYHLKSLVSADLDTFPLHPNERYVRAFVARSDLGIMTQLQAEQHAAAPGSGGRAAPGARTMLTVEDAARDYYQTSYMLADAFFGGPVRKKYGAPPDLDRVKIPLYYLQKFASLLPYDREGIAVCSADRFEELARKVFGADCQSFERDFVMSSARPGAFPLFLKIGGKVYGSQYFGIYYLCALLNVVHRGEFDLETRRRGRLYESRVVPAHFRKQGFTYHANLKVKNARLARKVKKDFEIDGVAVSPGAAYVIEAKYWNPRKFLGSDGRYSAYDDLIRGSIEGTQRERDRKKWKEVGVALAVKAEWIEENRERFGIPAGTAVKRALVTNTYPTAREYKGCEIIRVQYPDVVDAQDYANVPAGGGPGVDPVAPRRACSPDQSRARGHPGRRRK